MKLGRNYQCYEITSVMKFPVTTPIRWKNIVNCRLRASSNSTILTLFSGWTTCGSRTQIIALKFHNSYTILWMDHVWVQNTNYCTHGDNDCEGKVSTPKCKNNLSRTAIKATIKACQWTQVRQNMFSFPTQGFKSNRWQLRSTLRQPMGGGALCTWGCSIKDRSSVIYKLSYDINLKNL
jgi:hypothetical protein